ncbi:MAG: S16 family serine protease [Candidatus Bathyarchaeia archaeon]|jgi:Lon-like ATP-dependent protease|nr:AAA family ATPase [Candidatus Bathyarchaeota archaeon A05DMB-4]MDH7594855.1 AAA family ATPase [Candidatus Bathyarchaeota archaeon]
MVDYYFGDDVENIRGKKWDWKNFKTTKDYPVSQNLLDWVIGQERALSECYLCLEEWVHKLKRLEHDKWFKAWTDPNRDKPQLTKTVPPGPYLMLLGDPGTGKSLIGRALAAHLTELYKKNRIQLQDVVCWQNKLIPSEPKISCHPAGDGKKLILKEKLKETKKLFLQSAGLKILTYLMIVIACIFMFAGFYFLWQQKVRWDSNVMTAFGPLQESYGGDFARFMLDSFISIGTTTFLPAGMMLMFLVLVMFLGRFGMLGGAKGIGGAKATTVPKLIVDNSKQVAPFIDATGHGSSQLFGSIAWDPLQTGGLGTPEHQRVTAGDVHRANLGVLFIDEIKNLNQSEAVTLLTVLEDGQLPITMRSRWDDAGTAAMAVATEPVPCMCFLVGAGNFDSIAHIHPALMDRIYGYGKVVRMNNDMPNTLENRRKYVQFIAQEVSRFHLLPFSREACEEIVDEGRRRSNKRDTLTTRFRPMISIIKTAATLAMNEGCQIVERRHVIDAIQNHCKTIQKQILEHQIMERGKLLEIRPDGVKLGQIYGLAVVSDPYSGEMTGNVLAVKGFIEKRDEKRANDLKGYYKVTGIAKSGKEEFIEDSVAKVRSVILQKYGVDIAQEYFTHIDFAQAYGVDGPSAGVTMAILLCSLIEGKPVRQDVAVTGEINVGVDGVIQVTAVGGLNEKIKAAEMWGFKKVVIPAKNYKYSIDPKDYKIDIVPAETLEDYLEECLITTEEYIPFNHRNANKRTPQAKARLDNRKRN